MATSTTKLKEGFDQFVENNKYKVVRNTVKIGGHWRMITVSSAGVVLVP